MALLRDGLAVRFDEALFRGLCPRCKVRFTWTADLTLGPVEFLGRCCGLAFHMPAPDVVVSVTEENPS